MDAPPNARSSPAAATEQKERTLRQRLRGRLEGLVPWRRVAGPPRRSACPAPKVSIVIPMHGTAATVEKCVLSAMNQSLEEIEIVCVDDASTDACADIVRRLARRDARIQLIRHEHNRGLGGARNSGIQAARATYVSGIDSDDFILPEMMQRLWEASEDGRADVVACGFTRVHADGSPAAASYQPEPGWFSNDEQQLDIFEFLNPSFCNKLWHRQLFSDHNISFPENQYFEDLATTPRLLRFASEIRMIPDPLYCYVQREGSITNSTSPRHILDHFLWFEMLAKFLDAQGLMERHRQSFRMLIGKSLHYHTHTVTSEAADAAEQAGVASYLRTMLLLKLAYLEHRDKLIKYQACSLQDLLLTAECGADLSHDSREDPPQPPPHT